MNKFFFSRSILGAALGEKWVCSFLILRETAQLFYWGYSYPQSRGLPASNFSVYLSVFKVYFYF